MNNIQFPVEALNYLIFVIPGFALVWTFRYFTRSEKKGEFELAGLSFLAGLIILVVMELIIPSDKIVEILRNPYATALSFSLIAFLIGFFAALFRKTFNLDLRAFFDWFVKKGRG